MTTISHSAKMRACEPEDWCVSCHAHKVPMTRWERWLSIACYKTWMRLPGWLAMSKWGFTILPWAGNYAYRCFCKTPQSEKAGGRFVWEEQG